MRAEIVSVGTELLMGQTVDTNAAHLGQALADLGISVYRRQTVGDNHDRMLAAFRSALAENDIVFAIGGLGPTMDDITRDVLAEAMDDELRVDESIVVRLRRFFESRGLPVLASNLRQAWVPTHGRALQNPNGTAPGLLFENCGKIAIALPGPPGEFLPMLANEVVPYLRAKAGGRTICSRVVRICGLGESIVEDRVRDLMLSSNPTVAPYAKVGEVHLRVSAMHDDPAVAARLCEERVSAIAERLGSHVYAYDDEALEAAVVHALSARGATLALGESCTGGQLASRITEVPGASEVFLGGVVAYSNAAKAAHLDVDVALVERHGAVSAEVAAAMAEGARARFGADLGIGITGVAGPGGGSDLKPVGTVHIALADGASTIGEQNRFIGGRYDVRRRATQAALVMLRDWLLQTRAATMD
ncbi:MAG TPA: competence/damage-inducible protein A [Chthonomonadales bacterium]|nr:competence/damage-inducible protein A [Chthonomonadales bacterium]